MDYLLKTLSVNELTYIVIHTLNYVLKFGLGICNGLNCNPPPQPLHSYVQAPTPNVTVFDKAYKKLIKV